MIMAKFENYYDQIEAHHKITSVAYLSDLIQWVGCLYCGKNFSYSYYQGSGRRYIISEYVC